MSFDQEIADIRRGSQKAGADRDHWRFAGRQEKYVEAYRQVHCWSGSSSGCDTSDPLRP
jgi:hypothetical protein